MVVRLGLRAILEAQPGWTVVGEAENGQTAVAMAESLQPDIVILDIGIPVMDGLQATRRIRAVLPGTAILVFTAVDSEDLLRDVLAAGARGYLLKSDPDRLIVAAVAALADGLPFLNAGAAERLVEVFLRAAAASPEPLTPREREVAEAIAGGLSNKEIARRLGISVKTVETHRATLMRKIGARSAVDVARYAQRNNLTRE